MTAAAAQVAWSRSRVLDEPGQRLMVILAAPGCAYARRTGGCTNCGFAAAFGTGKAEASTDLAGQLKAVIRKIPHDVMAPLELDLFCSGSFFNEEEIPVEAQMRLCELVAILPPIRCVLLESRPEYVTAEALRRAVCALGGKQLEVGIGLESASQEIREHRIRKGFSFEQFMAAARLVSEAGARLLTYVLLKPIDTPEEEAIQDAIQTGERVFALGRELALPTRVALEPCFVAPGTPLHRAFLAGRYRPPWLWSVVEVLKSIAGRGPVIVGLSDEGTQPLQVPHNCDRCTPRVLQALAGFNLDQDLAPLAALDCPCKSEWRRDRQLGTTRP